MSKTGRVWSVMLTFSYGSIELGVMFGWGSDEIVMRLLWKMGINRDEEMKTLDAEL